MSPLRLLLPLCRFLPCFLPGLAPAADVTVTATNSFTFDVADVTITVASSLGTIESGKSKTFNVVLRGKKPFAIEKIECVVEKDAFKVKLTKATRIVHVIPITFTAPEKAGVLSEEFIVTIAGRPEPVTFKTKVTITNPNISEVQKSDEKLNSAKGDENLKSANSDEKLKSADNDENLKSAANPGKSAADLE